MPKARSKRSKKRVFYGNRYTTANKSSVSNSNISTASASKLKVNEIVYQKSVEKCEKQELEGNRIIDLQTLFSVFSLLCCPNCLLPCLELCEDSRFGLCSNLVVKCNSCDFLKGFSTTSKVSRNNDINTLIVLGLRLIGRGYCAGKKLCSTLCLPFLSKCSFRSQEKTLLRIVESCAQENMTTASREVALLKEVSNSKITKCGVSVDGTWQRRGYSSLNGCVSVISIDTGKVLDVEILSQFCRICQTKTSRHSGNNNEHICANHKGSAGNMEVVGAFRMFERSCALRMLQYTDYYGDGDCKAFEEVKDMYGVNSVQKLECIGHVQKRVGGRLRKLKKNTKGIGGKGKLTDKFIDKLQNYYGIAIRSNVGCIDRMQSSVIAAFFHCCSGKNNYMHRQCPEGPDSWCKFQKATFEGIQLKDKSPGLPSTIIKAIKPTYMELCDQTLLKKCLHGKTQNCNESFNGVVWNIIPKETFIELQTFRLGVYIAIILFNSGYSGLLEIFEKLGISVSSNRLMDYSFIDQIRVGDSKRHSEPIAKLARKKRRAVRKNKSLRAEIKEGLTYKSGEF